MRVAVTGAYGFSGKYMARRLLDQRHEVITLTNSPNRSNPFGETIKAFLYSFSDPKALENSLRGVGRIVHISITNPDRKSGLPYFSGKAEMEDDIQKTGMSYAILRPAVLFGNEDILINNIAWALRRLPVFGLYGDGRYRLQPIYVDDLAAAAVARIAGATNETINAIGPETFYYRDMVNMIAREIGSRALIVPMPAMLAYQSVRALGWMVGDVINTHDEVRGLMQERLYVDSPPLGTTKLSDWVHASRRDLGRQYASELQRRFDRASGYGSN